MTMEKAPTRAVFWDIDGTLLLTARAGMIAWEEAYGASGEGRVFPPVRPDGMTDHQIAAWLLLGHPGPFGELSDELQQQADVLVSDYASRLPQVLPQRQGRVLVNVPGVLERLDRDATLTSWVVTGNVESGAVAKLQHYGLAQYFAQAPGQSLRGAFSARVEPRHAIVSRAADEARRRDPTLRLAEMLVVGDTPHDIEGARVAGIPTLALATNTHTVDELEAHRPWLTLPALPEPEAFRALLAQRFQPTTA
jgi:phosphoglycolate phosphatase-like HAD superfamily hydrolase